MSDPEDFRPSTQESFPEDREITPEEFPPHYLSSISLYVMFGLFCTIAVYVLHWHFPVFPGLFYSVDGEIQRGPFTVACVFFALVVPLIVSLAFRKRTTSYMLTFLILIAILFGSALAFICVPLQWNFILLPLTVLALSHWLFAIFATFAEDISAGRFATGILLTIALAMLFLAAALFDVSWICWTISLVFFFITIFVGYNVRTMRKNHHLLKRSGLPHNEIVLAEGLSQFLLCILIVFPHALATGGFDVVHRKRRWMGPEDQ